MAQKRSIADLSVSSAFPTLGESLVPEPREMVIAPNRFRHTGKNRHSHGKFAGRNTHFRQYSSKKSQS